MNTIVFDCIILPIILFSKGEPMKTLSSEQVHLVEHQGKLYVRTYIKMLKNHSVTLNIQWEQQDENGTSGPPYSLTAFQLEELYGKMR